MILMFLLVSCSGSSAVSQTPITPDLSGQVETQEAGHYLWAYYQIYFDPETNTVEIAPYRQVADHWNVLKFLEKGPCFNCVSILGIADTGNGTKNFDVQVSHPFTTANLTGFDVRGIAMFAGSKGFPVSGLSTPDRYAGDGALVNADGFTTLYNGTTAGMGPGGFQGYFKGKYTPAQIPNALLNGYKRHISPGMTNTRNMFYANTSVIATYELDMPDTAFIFGYAVDASWAPATTKPVINPGSDFPPEANCEEPWKVDVTIENIDQGLTDEGGQAKLIIDVYDHQGKTSFFPPVIECPELFDGTVNGIWTADGADYTRFEATVENVKLAAIDDYMCLISVTDTEDATAPEWLDLKGYQIVWLTVADYVTPQNQPPVAVAHASDYSPNVNQVVNFFDDSTDPDGGIDITKWEWDFSFDPVDGFQTGSEEQNPSIQYPATGLFRVQLRVTDSALHQDMLDTPLEIEVGGSSNTPPIACGDADNVHPNINTLIHFYDCSIDEDGLADIVFYEWDLDGDGFYEKNIKDTTKIYTTGGDYNVQHRVTDTADNQDTLDTPLVIEVNGPPVAAAEADNTNPQLGQLVTLTNLSTDDDGNGDIAEVYWDIDGNGDYDDPEDIQDQDVVELFFYAGGVHNIGLKVVDEWTLEDELDTMIQITVTGFDPFCIELQDQYNSADTLYGQRVFNYYQGFIGDIDLLNYKDADGPWDFTGVPTSQPAICEWFTKAELDDPEPGTVYPNADFYFKEAAPVAGGTAYVPHQFIFDDPTEGDYLFMEGQWQSGQNFDYGDTFKIHHPICTGWMDSGSGTGDFGGLSMDITWTMTCLGTGAAIMLVNSEPQPRIINAMLIRHSISFVSEYISFSLLNYQWIDEDGNEICFMQGTNGLDGTNFSGITYTNEVICRVQKQIP